MTPTGDKTQPQRLLEEVDSTIQHTESEQYPTDPPEIVDAPKFPTILEQKEYWDEKQKALEASFAPPDVLTQKPPRKWSAARRRKFNEKKAQKKQEAQIAAHLVEHPMYDYPPKDGQISSWDKLPTPPREPVEMIRFCPHCGKGLERYLA